MFVVRTVENLANSVGKLVCSEKSVGFDHLALAVNPLRFDGVQPRALLRKQATDDPYPLSALFDSAVVGTEPTPHLFGDVPTGVVPDENENLLANGFELSHAPLEKAPRYRRNRPSVHEPDPRPIESGQVESVTAYGFRLGVVLGDRPLDEARGLALLGPGVERGQGHPAPPALVQEAHRPGVGIGLGHFHQSIATPFFLSYRGSGEVIQRLARIHLIPRRRESVARMVSPEIGLSTSPSSKATSAAISKVQRLLSRPNSLGERWSISRKASACSRSWKAL